MSIELKERERQTLCYIDHCIKTSPLKTAPTTREILTHLNEVLPRREDDKPMLTSTEQVNRIVRRLRELDLLLDPAKVPEIKGKQRNLMPTDKGQAWIDANCNA